MISTVDVVIPAFNAANTIGDTVRHIARQALPSEWQLRIFAVDDGSTDATRELLAELQQTVPELRCVFVESNGGRGLACNAGAAAGSGSVIVFCDADCRYTRPDAIAGFIADIDGGMDASIGFIEVPGDGFWAQYTNGVATERLESQDGLVVFSTANFAIRRDLFEKLDGYSPEYFKYGFEDKDLLVRMERSRAVVALRPDIRVSHDDGLSLRAVCGKAEQSARYSAPVFRSRFPDVYGRLAYARCDATLDSALRPFRLISAPLNVLARSLAAVALALPFIGFRQRRLAVRVAICAAFFHGTARRT